MAQQTPRAESPTTGVFPGGCLVLAKAGGDCPDMLLGALGSRGLAVRVVHDEPGVMAMLGEPSGGRRVLVVVEPEAWPWLADLMHAVNAYCTDVLCWQYAEQENKQPRLALMDQRFLGPGLQGQAAGSAGWAESSEGSSNDSGPVGRIVGRRRPVDALLTKVPGRPLSTREVVTQQELTMLLGPIPGEAS